METINIKLYEIFKQDFHLSDVKAREFTQVVEAVAKEKAEETFINFKSSFREDLLKLEMEMKQNKNELELKIEQNKTDLLKWFIGGFITIVIMILGLFATIILK
jgi:ATP-dependent Zn protease